MLYTAKIKVESAFLGNRRNKSGTMEFSKDGAGKLVIPVDQWEWLVEESCKSLRLDSVDHGCFLPPQPIFIPTTQLYSRNYTRDGQKQSCMHESVRKGAELEIDMVVSDSSPPRSSMSKNMVAPGVSDISQILKFIGGFLGLSPFGAEKGYGRFSLLSLDHKLPLI